MRGEKSVTGRKLYQTGYRHIQTSKNSATKVISSISGNLRKGMITLTKSKCEMARAKLCRKSSFGYCTAEDRDLETCPYLKAVEEIARLVTESIKTQDKNTL